MRIKKGDYVQIITGTDAGKKGRVLRVLPKKDKIVVEGANFVFKHLKKNQQSSQGGRVEVEAPIHISNVMIYCPHSQKPTRTFYRIEDTKTDKEEKLKKTKVRYSKKSGRQV